MLFSACNFWELQWFSWYLLTWEIMLWIPYDIYVREMVDLDKSTLAKKMVDLDNVISIQ